MATVVTAQTLNRYYDDYKDTEITFSKEIMRTLKMDPRQIYIKSGGLQWPCIISSTTFNIAKIIIGTKSGAYQVLSKQEPAPVSLRFSFYQPDGQLMSFFVSARVQICQPYMNSSDLAIVQLQYTQRPPDDLIQMIGNILDANGNAVKRKEDRIIINQDSMRRLGITKKEMVITIQNVPRHCILQDLSFGGAKIVLMGLAQYLLKKEVQLQLENGYLTVSAHKSIDENDTTSSGTLIRQEKTYGTLSRSFYVGEGIENSDIKARYENGVLIVSVPKKDVINKAENNKIFIE